MSGCWKSAKKVGVKRGVLKERGVKSEGVKIEDVKSIGVNF